MSIARPMQRTTLPLRIPVPGSATIEIKGTTNAAYHQRVTIEDTAEGGTDTFYGQGEGVAMQVRDHHGTDLVQLTEIERHYRMLVVTCQYSRTGWDSDYYPEAVVRARTWAEYGEGDANTPVCIYWEIDTEDGEDEDFNDSVIVITATISED